LWDSQGVTVSRLKRVRYGDIYLTKDMPRGGWMELELKEVNYLREVVELEAEENTMLTVEGLKRKRGVRQIRRAVRRHEERVTETPRGRRGRTSNPDERRSSTRNSEVEGQNAPAGKRKPSGKPSTAKPTRGKPSAGKPAQGNRRKTDESNEPAGKRKPSGNGAQRRNPLAGKPRTRQ
jgi:23S rRNA pseudouridine2605 synthase